MAHYDNAVPAGYNRSAALALWIGTAAGLTVMALHPVVLGTGLWQVVIANTLWSSHG